MVDILHPITLLPLLTGIRKDEGVQGRGVVTSGGSGSGGASVGSGPQKAAAGDARGLGGAGGQEGGGEGAGEGGGERTGEGVVIRAARGRGEGGSGSWPTI